jgi:deoxyribose-phosphate aldolase
MVKRLYLSLFDFQANFDNPKINYSIGIFKESFFMEPTSERLRQSIDHTLLAANSTEAQFHSLWEEAEREQFKAVCVPLHYVSFMNEKRKLSSSKHPPLVATVVGFPLGHSGRYAKREETKLALSAGADEIDMVFSLTDYFSHKTENCLTEVQAIKDLVKDKVLKVIIETHYLTNKDDLLAVSDLCVRGGCDYIKTSTGFAGSGARLEDIAILRSFLPPHIKIKASGGIKDRSTALAFLGAGADRLGTSSGIQIISPSTLPTTPLRPY